MSLLVNELSGQESRIQADKHRLEELRAAKGKLGREIAELRKAGQDVARLTEEIRNLSDQIKQMQKGIKKRLTAVSAPVEDISPGGVPEIPSPVLDRVASGPVFIRECFDSDLLKESVDAYVEAHPAGTVWHTTAVNSFIADIYGHQTRYLCALDNDSRVVGVLPLVQLKSRLFGNFVSSVPYFNYGGVLADSTTVARELVEEANAWRMSLGARHLELRHIQDVGIGLPQRRDKYTFWLPLPSEPSILWKSLAAKVRSQVRRGERAIDEVVIGGVELLDDFYRVFAHNMRDLGTPVCSKNFFRNLFETLSGRAWLVLVRLDGRAVGGAFLTGFRNTMEIPWASTLRNHNASGANMVMYWKVLEFAIQRNYSIFDFGRCSKGGGTWRFKQQWGGTPVPLAWDYLLSNGGSLPQLNPDNPRYRLLIAIWKHLPVWTTRMIGPGIVRSLP